MEIQVPFHTVPVPVPEDHPADVGPVHPELAAILASMPEQPSPFADIARAREDFRTLLAPLTDKTDDRLRITHTTIDGPDGNLIGIQVIRPTTGNDAPLPAVLYLHGGYFALGELGGPGSQALDISTHLPAVVVNVHYRLAPEHPYPAGVEDCYAALCWLAEHAGELGVAPGRIAVAGASAGACLAAAVTLLARDRQGPAIAFQSLVVPVTDDRPTASRERITDPRLVNNRGIADMWDAYLGPDRTGPTPACAAPARAASFAGLPPAYVLTCGLDPLRDEGLAYARRLTEADVPVETKDVPGAWHMFEFTAPHSMLTQQTTRHWLNALKAALT
ncbi:alpha/beta hydrolase [Streptomyces sp. NPDC056486]|uniref:alpha/beta hydrolase n=1 Tax=Streptomyces sp. NPDC056486 TaxID=3345835 RepID=UPI0036971592